MFVIKMIMALYYRNLARRIDKEISLYSWDCPEEQVKIMFGNLDAAKYAHKARKILNEYFRDIL